MAEHWDTPALLHLLRFVVWLAFVTEIRLLMTVTSSDETGDDEEDERFNALTGAIKDLERQLGNGHVAHT